MSLPCQKYLDFEQKQEIKKKQQDDEINEEIDLNRVKDETDASIYFGDENYSFFLMCLKLNLNKDNENFIDFLSSDVASQILRENMLPIHIGTGNTFYKNYNTNESIHNFWLREHDETKKIIHATLT